MDEQPDYDYYNLANIGVYQGNLVADFDVDQTAMLELSPEELAAVEAILSTKDFWASFLGSISAALTQNR